MEEILRAAAPPTSGIDLTHDAQQTPIRLTELPMPKARKEAPARQWVTFGPTLDKAGEDFLSDLYQLSHCDPVARESYLRSVQSVIQVARNYVVVGPDIVRAMAIFAYLKSMNAGGPQIAETGVETRLIGDTRPLHKFATLVAALGPLVARVPPLTRRRFQGYLLAFRAGGPDDDGALFIAEFNED